MEQLRRRLEEAERRIEEERRQRELAQHRAQEERRQRELSDRRADDAERQVQEEHHTKVVSRLLHNNERALPGLFPEPSPSSSPSWSGLPLSVEEDAVAVMEGFDARDDGGSEDRICRCVVAAMRDVERPQVNAKENTVVHGFFASLIGHIRSEAIKEGITVNKGFHEQDAMTEDGGRPDWVFTRPHEQRHGFLNRGFYLEVKRPVQRPGDKNSLFREGMNQVIQRIGDQHIGSGYQTHHGIGVVSDSNHVVIVRVKLSRDDTRNREHAPILISCGWELFPPNRDGAASAEPEEIPLGLRFLVRLLCESNLERFGLPPHNGVPRSVMECWEKVVSVQSSA